MKLIQITDCHLFSQATQLGYGDINPYRSLQKVLYNASTHEPSVILFTGDVSGDGSKQSYQHFSCLLQQSGMDCEYVILPGNHDDQLALTQQFPLENLWARQFTECDNWMLHYLNTYNHPNTHNQSKTDNQSNTDKQGDNPHQDATGWLHSSDLTRFKQQVARYPHVHHLVAVHHHPIPTGGWMDSHAWLNRDDFNQVIAELPQVRLVIHGHIHMALEQQLADVHYLSTPSSCWQWANTPQFSASRECAGYRILELSNDGQFSTEVVRV